MQSETRIVASLSMIVFCVMLGLTIIAPILPLYAKSFGASETMVGALISGFGVARVMFAVPGGIAAERRKPKTIIVLSLLLIVLASIICGLAIDYWTLFLGRFLEGMGSAFYVTTSLTILAMTTQTKTRGRSMSLYTGMLLLGSMIGPGLGGFAAYLWGLNAPFFLYALIVGIGMLWAHFELKLPEERWNLMNRQRHFSFDGVSKLIKNPSLFMVNIATFALFFVRAGITSTVIPLYAYVNLSLDEATLGLILTITSLFTFLVMMPSGALSDKYGRKPFMMLCLLMTALTVYLIPNVASIGSFWIVMIGYGATLGLSGPMVAWIADLTPTGMMGTSMGLFRMISDLGFLFGPLLLGYLADISKTSIIQPLPFQFTSILMIITALALIKVKDSIKGQKLL
ncbi:MAG: MFS transporter [Nitrososphaerales archaeon]